MRVVRVPKGSKEMVIENLKPYTPYKVRVGACFNQSETFEYSNNQSASSIPPACNIGEPNTEKTLSSPPEGQKPPTLVAKGPNEVGVEWEVPGSPNGEIKGYRVVRRDARMFEETVYRGAELEFTDAELKPFTEYEYKVGVSIYVYDLLN